MTEWGTAAIVRKERMIRAVMFHLGWRPATIEAVADGTLDPYHPDAGPQRP